MKHVLQNYFNWIIKVNIILVPTSKHVKRF